MLAATVALNVKVSFSDLLMFKSARGRVQPIVFSIQHLFMSQTVFAYFLKNNSSACSDFSQRLYEKMFHSCIWESQRQEEDRQLHHPPFTRQIKLLLKKNNESIRRRQYSWFYMITG